MYSYLSYIIECYHIWCINFYDCYFLLLKFSPTKLVVTSLSLCIILGYRFNCANKIQNTDIQNTEYKTKQDDIQPARKGISNQRRENSRKLPVGFRVLWQCLCYMRNVLGMELILPLHVDWSSVGGVLCSSTASSLLLIRHLHVAVLVDYSALHRAPVHPGPKCRPCTWGSSSAPPKGICVSCFLQALPSQGK